MQPILTVGSVVCPSVMIVSCAKTVFSMCCDNADEMPFGLWSRVGPKNHTLYTASRKNVPPLVRCNLDTREHILIFFGKNVTHKLSNQKHFTMPPQIMCASALPHKTGNTKIAFFHSNAVLVHCQNSTSRSLISSVFLTHDSYSCCAVTP